MAVAMPAQGQKSWDCFSSTVAAFDSRESQCLPRGRNPGTTPETERPPASIPSQCLPRGRNPGTVVSIGLLAVAQGVAMPAQGQKSWDTPARALGILDCLSQCLPRGRNPGTWPCGVAMPAQGKESWDAARVEFALVAMPAQGQKSWDVDWTRGARVAMPAQGQKSWDLVVEDGWGARLSRNACPGAEILGPPKSSCREGQTRLQCQPRGRNPGTFGRCESQEMTVDSNACSGAEVLGPHAPAALAEIGVAMPAQGQKSWDTSRSTNSYRNTCPGAEILEQPKRRGTCCSAAIAMPAQRRKSWDVVQGDRLVADLWALRVPRDDGR
jgi:hypothetical protein